jgi:hypothetical protein
LLQWIYDDLTEIRLEILFHQMWCDPGLAIQQLGELAETHEPNPLVFGFGGFPGPQGGVIGNVGDYVIAEMSAKMQWMADDGTVIAAIVSLTLTQYLNSTANQVASQMGASADPPGLTTSQSSSPGATIITGPASSSPSGIPPQTPYTNVPATTIARGYGG